MRKAEAAATELVRRFPEAKKVLEQRGLRREKTVGAQVDRLELAVRIVFDKYRNHSRHKTKARKAMAAMEIARGHRWALAMSANRIPRAEAIKHAITDEDRQDLYQAGVIGLMDAAKRFDPNRGFRFATYAAWWVRARMTRALTPHAVTVPPHLNEKRMRLRKALRTLATLGSSWTMEDLVNESGMPREIIDKVLARPLTTVYLDQNIDDDALPGRETRLLEALEDPTVRDPADSLSDHADEQWLTTALKQLTPRQQRLIDMVYGISNGQSMSLSAAGKIVGLSRERVRQICRQAIEQLRAIAIENARTEATKSDQFVDPPRIKRTDILSTLNGDPMQIKHICIEITGHYTPQIRQRVYNHLARLRADGLVIQEGHSRTASWRKVHPEA